MGSKIKRLLVANRGEIAVRILRACRELGIETVQVFSEADRDSLAVRMADRSVCIGGPKPQESYLDARRILAAASALGVDAIHPGYGFLSENADFADLVEAEGFIFVGPTGASIRAMGRQGHGEEAGRRGRRADHSRFQRRGGLGRGSGSDCRAHRLSRAVEGVGGRRRARNAGCQRSVDDREGVSRSLARSHHCVRQWRHVSGKIPDRYPAHRDPGAGRWAQYPASGRAGLFLSTSESEACRGESVAGIERVAARADRRGGGPPVQARELSKRRHDRVHSRSRIAALLLHGNEHADPGRASCHRNGLRH